MVLNYKTVDLSTRKTFFYDETQEEFAQRSCGSPIPGSVKGWVGQGLEQPVTR